jgi:adenylate cyclase
MIHGDFPTILIFSVSVSFLGNLFIQINDLVGRGVLLSYITGKYHKPVAEERFFMFLDLESSTTIAETIGPLKYHKFMNSYFYDINDPIAESKGEIYQYVGDEVVISWKKREGMKNSNCIECYFKIKETIDTLKNEYIKQFGLVPGFKAGVHFGEVIIGEIGDSKKDIVFHGDVMNTASRIQGQAKVLHKNLVISAEALKLLMLNGEYKTEIAGKFKLKGKEHETEIYSIEKNL